MSENITEMHITKEFDLDQPVFPYLLTIIVISCFLYLFELYLSKRQLDKFYEKERPQEIENIIDQADFDKAQEHKKDFLSFDMLEEYLNNFEDFIVWIFKLPAWLWVQCNYILIYYGYNLDPLDDNRDIYQGLVFLSIMYIFSKTKNLPWSLYKTFVLKERHGFNKSTIKLYIKDEIKMFLLTLFLGVPIYILIMKVINWGGEHFYVYLFIVYIILILIFINVLPNWILPLFNTYTDLQDGSLKTKIQDLAKRLKFPLTKIFVVDQSVRSSHSNAYFYGFGRDKRIVLFDTLIKQHPEDEIVAIVGHELGHWYFSHNIQNIFVALINAFIFFFIFSYVITRTDIFISFGFSQQSNFIGFMLFAKIWTPIGYIVQVFMCFYIRSLEFQADQFSKKNDMGHELCQGLIRIHVKNAANLNPDPLYASIKFNHPELVERLKALNYDGSKIQEFVKEQKKQEDIKEEDQKEEGKKDQDQQEKK